MNGSVRLLIVFISLVCFWSLPSSFANPVERETALKAAKTFLKAEKTRNEKDLIKTIGKKVAKEANPKGFEVGEIKEIFGKDDKVLAYVAELEPEGFIITAADNNIRPILGYALKGKFSFEDSKKNVLLHLVKRDVEERLKVMDLSASETESIAQTNSSLWSRYNTGDIAFLETLSSTTQWGPLINSDPNQTWGQSSPYNDFCPIDPVEQPGRCMAGCTAIAMAQIIYYWGFPPTVAFSSNDRYESWFWQKSFFSRFWIDDTNDILGYPSFNELNSAMAELFYDNDPNEKAYLTFAVGIKNKMQYSYWASGAPLSADAYKNGFSYGSAIYKSGFIALNWSEYEPKVIENIKKGWPVQIGVRGSSEPHSLIVDGYKSTGEFHLNFGWGNYLPENIWYFLPNDPNLGWNSVKEIIYDICPYFGWGQFGSDAKNTRGTRYSGPEEHKIKFIIDMGLLNNQVELSTAIAGAEGKLFVFCIAKNASDPGKIFVISHRGEPVDEIDIPAPAQNSSEPAQSGSFGLPVYITMENRIYRISMSGEVNLVFEDTNTPSEDFVYPTHVDIHGNVYVTGWDKIYSLSGSGQVRWSKAVPNTNLLDFCAGIALDEERGRLYAKYYDPDNDTAHLWALNKDAGSEVWDVPVPAVTSYMAAVGEPTVGDDGTIFVRFWNSLRAYDPNGSLRWDYSVNPSDEYLEPFVSLGPNGNIYIGGSHFSSTPKYAWLRSLRVSDKALLWEFTKQYPSDSSNYDFRAPAVAYDNNMIYAVFHELSSPGYRKLYALKENIGGITEMWEHDGAEAILIGSTGSAYLLDREAEKIIALASGQVGDPEGAGMAYTNNSAPNTPSSPTPSNGEPNQDYLEPLLLSWTCSDPEGHPLKYDVYLGESGVLGLYAQNDWNDTNCIVTSLRPGTGYFWKVVATDGQAVKEGPIWTLATKPANTDLNGDGIVNFVDYAFLANRWMNECSEPDWCTGTDVDQSGAVNIDDLLIIAQHWLEGATTPVNDIIWIYINDPGVDGHEPFNGYMSKYETTNFQYCQFLNSALNSGDINVGGNWVKGANGSNPGADFVGKVYYNLANPGYTYNGATNGGATRIHYSGGVFTVDSGFENHPVTCVSWYGATAFCNYYGWRLPTEWEWQAVADYDGTYLYGCGATINNSIANYAGSTHPDGTTTVGAFGTYGYGVCDMAGNTWEWTSSILHDSYYAFCGGGWYYGDISCVVSYRGADDPSQEYGYYAGGFRVCR